MRKRTTGEHVKQRHQTACGLFLQLFQLNGVNTGKYHKRSETVDGRKQKGDEDSLTQILNLPTVLQCLYKLFHLLR